MSLEEAPREVMGGDWARWVPRTDSLSSSPTYVCIITPPTNAPVLMTYEAMGSSEQSVGVGKLT
jgi:hypothetical protein